MTFVLQRLTLPFIMIFEIALNAYSGDILKASLEASDMRKDSISAHSCCEPELLMLLHCYSPEESQARHGGFLGDLRCVGTGENLDLSVLASLSPDSLRVSTLSSSPRSETAPHDSSVNSLSES